MSKVTVVVVDDKKTNNADAAYGIGVLIGVVLMGYCGWWAISTMLAWWHSFMVLLHLA